MATNTLTESVKTRIPQDWKEELQQMADKETLGISDIVRRAIAEFIARRAPSKTQPQTSARTQSR